MSRTKLQSNTSKSSLKYPLSFCSVKQFILIGLFPVTDARKAQNMSGCHYMSKYSVIKTLDVKIHEQVMMASMRVRFSRERQPLLSSDLSSSI